MKARADLASTYETKPARELFYWHLRIASVRW
jgi:hypothetical protein